MNARECHASIREALSEFSSCVTYHRADSYGRFKIDHPGSWLQGTGVPMSFSVN
ncbi:hypothetical protein CY34DRAFT_806403 [Suillus luteus UH-Slu-Lm8-n1]|uniref:Uncharacterized protein n=1 Tax=Suillus luteus UH-Slu-Lm8-n1 TaxID=930992 RepID=A0A0D0AH60_9AGAM|nr:hypothetical protein CY34DRAFT_806403 [Suillus luteus UH-Slu-Lm8-n1]